MIEFGLNYVLVYTLMLLSGSELDTEKVREQYGIVSKYRVPPRCFGKYTVFGKEFSIGEVEKVAVANTTLSFKDYLTCRVFFLVVNLFYNHGIFEELVFLLKRNGISIFQWLREIFKLIVKGSDYPRIKELFSDFLRETKEELWDSKEELLAFLSEKSNIEKYIKGELGSNLAYKYQVLALVRYSRPLHEIAFRAAEKLIFSKTQVSDRQLLREFLKELKKFNIAKKEDPFDFKRSEVLEFNFDFIRFGQLMSSGFSINDSKAKTSIRFSHNKEQKENLERYLRLYGDDVVGISLILSKIYIKKIFREAAKIP